MFSNHPEGDKPANQVYLFERLRPALRGGVIGGRAQSDHPLLTSMVFDPMVRFLFLFNIPLYSATHSCLIFSQSPTGRSISSRGYGFYPSSESRTRRAHGGNTGRLNVALLTFSALAIAGVPLPFLCLKYSAVPTAEEKGKALIMPQVA